MKLGTLTLFAMGIIFYGRSIVSNSTSTDEPKDSTDGGEPKTSKGTRPSDQPAEPEAKTTTSFTDEPSSDIPAGSDIGSTMTDF